jgi:hypothetical protein
MRQDGRHARGTWTPQVAPGSGGRRHLREARPAEAAEPATVAVGALRSAATTVFAPVTARAAGPIRYAPVPGAPRRASLALWGPPSPAGA